MASSTSSTVLVLNGPNLNMLGTREPEVYGHQTLDDISKLVASHAESHGLTSDFRQSNSESELVTWIQQTMGSVGGIIINAGAYTHTSVALPMIEIHLSNVFQREDFRHHSYLSPVARGVICGFGANSYLLAVDAMAGILKSGS